jgi:hypothetical protein
MKNNFKSPFESEHFAKAISNASAYGFDAHFWIRSGDVRVATRKARQAARHALKAEAINPESFARIAQRIRKEGIA